jgi:hypothetical protein
MRKTIRFWTLGCVLAAALPAAASDLAYLQSLLSATPQGGWVKASTNKYSDAFATGTVAAPETPSGPQAIVYAWGSAAWDSTRGNLLLWGGGHANYAGNEMYVWQGANGSWTRGSLPSMTAGNFIVDNAAPQSAHTYDTNIYLPVNQMFLTLGGAAYNSGGNFETNVNGVISRAGPWLWDPAKADANLVGGTSGSGYDSGTAGGNMWINRAASLTGTQGPSYVYGATAYREEGGRDVVYVLSDSNASGFPRLFRYELGDVRNGGSDSFELVGVTDNLSITSTLIKQTTATIDSREGLFVATATAFADLAVWDLDRFGANPFANREVPVQLVTAGGAAFDMNQDMSIEYDSLNGQYVMWDGRDRGTVWVTRAQFNPDGSVAATWVVDRLASTTGAQPGGSFSNGVLGKWDYVAELDAFVAINEWSFETQDAEVWLYKPFAAAVPEPGSAAVMLLGLLGLGAIQARKNTR